MEFSHEQKAVREALKAGENVLLTGPAGSGKSTVLNDLRERYGRHLSITASTGIAALNVGGTTVHAFAGLGLAQNSAREIADNILSNGGRALANITQCRILAIDEVSMISGELFTKVEEVFRLVREDPNPWGGVQLFLTGDFTQLPPVSRGPQPATFAFESPAWREAGIQTKLLTRVYRQDDQAFVDALGQLRIGNTNHPSYRLIERCNNRPMPATGIKPVIIHTHNVDVDRKNLEELAKLPGKEFSYRAVDSGSPAAREKLNNDCLAPEILRLKVGAQVMLLTNLNLEVGLANGALGEVVELSDASIRVRFKEGIVSMETKVWEIQNGGHVTASRTQFPLRLAYALSCHKVQGMTIEAIECFLSRTFEYGQAYVAVSRAKSLAGLFLRDVRPANFRAHPKAIRFYEQAMKEHQAVHGEELALWE